MLAVIALFNDYHNHIPYDYRDGIHPEFHEDFVSSWPIYDDDQMEHLVNRLEMVCDDALEEGIRAFFTIVKIAGTPSALHYDFIYQPMMSDLFEDGIEVFSNGEPVKEFSPEHLLTFQPSMILDYLDDDFDGKVEPGKGFYEVADLEVVENTRRPIASTPYPEIGIVAITDDYVIYSLVGEYGYHRSDIIDGEYFLVDQLRIDLNECMMIN